MNILFLFYAPMLPYVGGIQRVTNNLTKGLTARGHKVCYLSIYNVDSDVEYNYPAPQFYLDERQGSNNTIKQYKSLLLTEEINVVINQEPRGDLLKLLSYTPEGIKKITCYHLQPFFVQGNSRNIMKYYHEDGLKASVFKYYSLLFPALYEKRVLALEREIFERTLTVSDKLCLLSDKFVQRMMKFMPHVNPDAIVAANNPNTFYSVSCSEIPKKEKIILWVGRQTNAQKNFPLFVDFWTVFQKCKPEWKALVLGSGIDLEFNKKYAARKKTLNLEFLGSVTDVASYYKRASFLVMTSNYEGWGMVLTEAMNYGCIPCAFDTYESLHDIIVDDKNGIIVQNLDYRQMVKRIETLITSPSSLSAMQVAAMEIKNNFNVDLIVNQWEKIFNTL